MITQKEMSLVLSSIRFAQSKGAGAVRITLCKSTENLVGTLDGKIDKVSCCQDRSMDICLYVEGRFGSFSTNRCDQKAVEDFIIKAIDTVKMLAPDECRGLPQIGKYCTAASSGNELGTCDPSFDDITPDERIRMALECSSFAELKNVREGFTVISEEGEYSDSIFDTFIADSQGLKCRHTETNHDYGVEVTIEAPDGEKYSGYWWESSTCLKDFKPQGCSKAAVARAAEQIGSTSLKSGKYNMVVDTQAASRLVTPLLRALNGYALQQDNSFLKDSLGKCIFHKGLTIMDTPHRPGEAGSKLFDSEGVRTTEAPIIENGTVRQYFINSYISRKLGMKHTVEDATRPSLLPWPRKGLTRTDLMALCGDGILVNEFNGGNSDSATGDFSFGITGQHFSNGKTDGPVSEMIVTGNFITLWNDLLAAADDCRPCMSKLIPTLAFSNVDFNGQ